MNGEIPEYLSGGVAQTGAPPPSSIPKDTITVRIAALEVHKRLKLLEVACYGGLAGFVLILILGVITPYAGMTGALLFSGGAIFLLYKVRGERARLEQKYNLGGR